MAIDDYQMKSVTSNCIDYAPWWPFGVPMPCVQPLQWTWTVPAAPTECSGDVHVFPCPHCDKCKCGKAVKA